MNKIDFINKFVKSYEIEDNRFSCLMIALTDARKITAHFDNHGKFEFNVLETNNTFLSPFSFIGIINYLLFLEMIGEIFKLKTFNNTKTNKKTNNIYKALKQFGNNISEKDIWSIVALRNSLAHNYGLINIPFENIKNIKKREMLTHKFILSNVDNTDLIIYPTNNWKEKDFSDKNDNTSTRISIFKLIDFIESVYLNLKKAIEFNQVELSLDGDLEELKARFTIQN